MPKIPLLSGKKVIAILCKKFDFSLVSQKGSHIKLRKILEEETITVIVPNHTELALGTFRNILRQAKIDSKQFLQHII